MEVGGVRRRRTTRAKLFPYTTLFRSTDKILEGMDERKLTGLVLLDLSKAFDT